MQTKKILTLAGIMAISALIFLNSGPAQADDPTWTAIYWNNPYMTGDPALTRQEAVLNHDWGLQGPAAEVIPDNFSAAWNRNIHFPESATYRFTATTDDGMRVYVDDELIIDAWYESEKHSISSDLFLESGDHYVVVEYYEDDGAAFAGLNYERIGGITAEKKSVWHAEYFDNAELSGEPVLTQSETAIDHKWATGASAEGIPADNFSVRWTSTMDLEPGNYLFSVTADDGVRLWVNNEIVIDQWRQATPVSYQATVAVPGGATPIRMEYFEGEGGAVASLTFLKESALPNGPWEAEYFNNATLEGDPVLTRTEDDLDFEWGSDSPAEGIAPDNFSVRMTQNVNLEAGLYRFILRADDGVRLLVNGDVVIDGWYDHRALDFVADVELAGGSVPIQVEYYEKLGEAEVSLEWSRIDTQEAAPLPAPGEATGTVLSALLNVRRGPGLEYNILGQLTQGETVSLTGFRSENSGWVTIDWNGQEAWISTLDYLLETNIDVSTLEVYPNEIEVLEEETDTSDETGAGEETEDVEEGEDVEAGEEAESSDITAVVANTDNLNVYAAPSEDSEVLTTLATDTEVVLLGRDGTTAWIQIQLESGDTGWVSADNLAPTSEPLDTLPVIDE